MDKYRLLNNPYKNKNIKSKVSMYKNTSLNSINGYKNMKGIQFPKSN